MPNHVKNVILLDGDPLSIKKLMEQIAEDNEQPGKIDFQKIIPMPESLHVESGSTTQIAIESVLKALEHDHCYWMSSKLGFMSDDDYDKRRRACGLSDQKLLELGLQYIMNKVRYGHTTWYGWCIENWGTKWNAYDRSVDDDNEFSFNTAWSAPYPVIDKIAQMFPDVQITHKWADEDIGSNCGRMEYKDGKLIAEWFPNGEIESIEYACGLWDYDADEYIAELESEGNEVS